MNPLVHFRWYRRWRGGVWGHHSALLHPWKTWTRFDYRPDDFSERLGDEDWRKLPPPNFCEACAMDLETCDCANPRPTVVVRVPPNAELTGRAPIERGARMPNEVRSNDQLGREFTSAWAGPTLWTAQTAAWFNEQGRARQEIYRHKKTGGIYGVVCNATRESDGVLLVVYRNVETGDRWVRPASEFNDGRFERVA